MSKFGIVQNYSIETNKSSKVAFLKAKRLKWLANALEKFYSPAK